MVKIPSTNKKVGVFIFKIYNIETFMTFFRIE